MLLIYHSKDLDGWSSGYLLKKKFPNGELFGYHYGEPIPWDKMNSHSEIVMADVSFPADVMEKLAIEKDSFVWLDHHISAIKDLFFPNKELKEYDKELLRGDRPMKWNYKNMTAWLNTKYSAAEIVWAVYHSKVKPIGDVSPCGDFSDKPFGLNLIGLYDSFRHNELPKPEQEQTMQFQYAARAFVSGVDNVNQAIYADNYLILDTWLEHGDTILLRENQKAKKAFERAFPIHLDGHFGYAVNEEKLNPKNFDVDTGEAEFVLSFWMKEDMSWECSIYATGYTDIDVSKIAKKRNGGGHIRAAGMKIDNIDALLKNALIEEN